MKENAVACFQSQESPIPGGNTADPSGNPDAPFQGLRERQRPRRACERTGETPSSTRVDHPRSSQTFAAPTGFYNSDKGRSSNTEAKRGDRPGMIWQRLVTLYCSTDQSQLAKYVTRVVDGSSRPRIGFGDRGSSPACGDPGGRDVCSATGLHEGAMEPLERGNSFSLLGERYARWRRWRADDMLNEREKRCRKADVLWFVGRG